MRIAYVSSEYPPDTAIGGIATYTAQVARAMAARGHSVEIFAGSPLRSACEQRHGVTVNWIKTLTADAFPPLAAAAFAQRHHAARFDVVEGPEFQAEARLIASQFPSVPLVVKLHTPSLWVGQLNGECPPSCYARAAHFARFTRMVAGAWRRGVSAPKWFACPNRWADLTRLDAIERAHTQAAAIVAGPSRAILQLARKHWKLPEAKLRHVPNVYAPAPDLLALPVRSTINTVGFIGRLEVRKGILDLAAAVPHVLRAHPLVKFRLVGRALPVPHYPGLYADDVFRDIAGSAMVAVSFVGSVPLDRLPSEYGKVSICVIPSHWENFPNVCLEAMIAGRAIVASDTGGISEMLSDGCGVLVPPQRPTALANALSALLADPDECAALGARARSRVLAAYSPSTLIPIVERCYIDAIASRYST